jgi:Ca-activated chloride channel family protein
MHVSAHLNVDLVALDEADDVTCLVQLTAPIPAQSANRPGQSLVVVLDRSGSMSGPQLEGAKDAIAALVRRLAPQDCFGLVTFDDAADVVIPVREMKDHDVPTLETLIGRISPGGSTDLSGGYLLGLRELKRSLRATNHIGATLLLVSDGHANAGMTDPVQMRDLAGSANARHRVTTSTLGIGEGYDEVLLEAMTRGGNGTHAFAPDVDTAMNAIQEVVTDLLDKSVVAALMRIHPQLGLVDSVQILQDLPNWVEGDAVVVNLGDMYAGEERKTLFTLHVPAMPTFGTATIADVVFEYTSLPDLREHIVTLPVAVNVVPGDEARNRVPNPIVAVEQLMVGIDSRKRDIASNLRSGDSRSAQRTLAGALKDVSTKREEIKDQVAEASLRTRLDDAARDLLKLADDVRSENANFAGKSVMNSYAATSRGRNAKVTQQSPPSADAGSDSDSVA